MAPRPSRKPRFKLVKGPCPFCTSRKEADYKDARTLAPYITERGKILAKNRTGVCAKHQRRLTKAIKRARHLALLSFIAGPNL